MNSQRLSAYACVSGAAFLVFASLAMISGFSELARESIIRQQLDLQLRASARFLFENAILIRHRAVIAGALVWAAGLWVVWRAPTPEYAVRRAMWASTLISALSGLALFWTVVSILSVFMGGVIKAVSLPR